MITLKQLENQYEGTTPKNINDFIWNIRSCVSSRSIPTLHIIGFLDRLIMAYVPKAQAICDSAIPNNELDASQMLMHAKILSAHILLLHQTRSYKEMSEKIVLLLQWSACSGGSDESMVATALSSQTHQCTDPGYTWDTIRNAVSIGFITYHIVTKGRFDGAPLPSLVYDGKGSAYLEEGVLHISSFMGWRAGIKAWEGCDGHLMIHTRNSRDEKLKASYVDNSSRLMEFAKTFTMSQASMGNSAVSLTKEVKIGEALTIKCDEIREEDNLCFMDALPLYTNIERKGTIINEELVKGIWTVDIIPYFYEGDCIKGAILVDDGATPLFSIQQAYRAFAKKAAEKDLHNNTIFEAIAVHINKEQERINWITSGGYGAISLMMDNVKVGDKAVLTVKNVQSNGLYINVDSPKYGYDHIDRIFDEEQILSAFITNEIAVWKEVSEAAEKTPEDKAAKENVLKAISRILFHSKTANTLDRYRSILAAQFLSECIDDAAGVSLSGAESVYLGKIISFAQGGNVGIGDLPAALPQEKRELLNCLSLVERGTLHDFAPMLLADGILGQIASLLTARIISGEFTDEVKTEDDTIRKKISSLLGISDCFIESGRVAAGKYGQTERRDLEFKSSYIFRNDNGLPDIDYQGRCQVFEAVCGFLNRDGGTVYVGVNDAGDPILSETGGINGDIAWFRSNFQSVLSRRMHQLKHGIPRPDSIEHYALFLNHEKELYFKKSILDKIIIEPTDDADAIRITVKPSLYEIAYLYDNETHTHGVAYVRDGGSTLPMSEQQKRERLMNQKQVTKEVEFAVILQQACDQKRKVILRGYHSGNSGEVKDRLVVPINLFYNDENVLCYDLDSCSEKQFRLARITSIDTDIDQAEYPHCFLPKEADAFRWIGDDNYHIKVRMDVGAYNYLLEEYSAAKDLPSDELYREESGKWIMDTHLHGLGAIRRFYLGLADKIEILETEDSEKLLKDISSYITKHIDVNKE